MSEDILDDEAFDAELQALFAEAAPPETDPVFVEQVIKRLGSPERTRLIALGGAGATGSAIAGTQLEALISQTPVDQVGGVLGQALGFVGPEALVTAVLGLVALGFAWVLPGSRGLA